MTTAVEPTAETTPSATCAVFGDLVRCEVVRRPSGRSARLFAFRKGRALSDESLTVVL